MKISIANLSEGIHKVHFSVEAESVGLEEKFSKDVTVDVVLNKTSREVFLQAEVGGLGRFTCDRCVDEFERQITNAFDIVYLHDEKESEQYPDDEVHMLEPGTTQIDITEDVRQFIMLAVPLKLLCREECAGLCHRCGSNLNRGKCSCKTEEIDPRWEGLHRLLEK